MAEPDHEMGALPVGPVSPCALRGQRDVDLQDARLGLPPDDRLEQRVAERAVDVVDVGECPEDPDRVAHRIELLADVERQPVRRRDHDLAPAALEARPDDGDPARRTRGGGRERLGEGRPGARAGSQGQLPPLPAPAPGGRPRAVRQKQVVAHPRAVPGDHPVVRPSGAGRVVVQRRGADHGGVEERDRAHRRRAGRPPGPREFQPQRVRGLARVREVEVAREPLPGTAPGLGRLGRPLRLRQLAEVEHEPAGVRDVRELGHEPHRGAAQPGADLHFRGRDDRHLHGVARVELLRSARLDRLGPVAQRVAGRRLQEGPRHPDRAGRLGPAAPADRGHFEGERIGLERDERDPAAAGVDRHGRAVDGQRHVLPAGALHASEDERGIGGRDRRARGRILDHDGELALGFRRARQRDQGQRGERRPGGRCARPRSTSGSGHASR